MPLGRCRLCRQERELRNSHLIPKACYKRLAERDGESGAILVAKKTKTAVRTSKQATAHLLCGDCEQRFNQRGEGWVIEHAWQHVGDFPLQRLLLAETPEHETSDFRMYDVRQLASVHHGQLVYFALSVLWRATLCDWRIGDHELDRLDLGPYEEELRAYLNDERDTLPNVGVLVGVTMPPPDERNGVVTAPYLFKRDSVMRTFRIVVSGLVFQVLTGKGIPNQVRALWEHARIFMSTNTDAYLFDGLAREFGAAKARGKLAKQVRNPFRGR
jgi:hypothetical protein